MLHTDVFNMNFSRDKIIIINYIKATHIRTTIPYIIVMIIESFERLYQIKLYNLSYNSIVYGTLKKYSLYDVHITIIIDID